MSNNSQEKIQQEINWTPIDFDRELFVKLSDNWEVILDNFCRNFQKIMWEVNFPIFKRSGGNWIIIKFAHFLWIFWRHISVSNKDSSPFLENWIFLLKSGSWELDPTKKARAWIDRLFD